MLLEVSTALDGYPRCEPLDTMSSSSQSIYWSFGVDSSGVVGESDWFTGKPVAKRQVCTLHSGSDALRDDLDFFGRCYLFGTKLEGRELTWLFALPNRNSSALISAALTAAASSKGRLPNLEASAWKAVAPVLEPVKMRPAEIN